VLEIVPEYLVIGHVTKDLTPEGNFGIGGTATYSALTADHLGLAVGVITSAEPSLSLFQQAPSIAVRTRPSAKTTTFENTYTDGRRRQRLGALAERLTIEDLPSGWSSARIVHLGPVAQEVDYDLVRAFPHSLLGVTPQGWLRSWDVQGVVSPVEWGQPDRILDVADVVILSLEDVGGDWERVNGYARGARLLVVTLGEDGAVVYCRGERTLVPAYDIVEVDSTGAGDVFAAAYLNRFFETRDALEAARFANCVASFSVEGVGPMSLPSREQIEQRLLYGSLRDQTMSGIRARGRAWDVYTH
jgi:sugar/nucleoside kinase (ribokinase family)